MAPTTKVAKAEPNETLAVSAPKGIVYLVIAAIVGAGGGTAMAGGLAAHSVDVTKAAGINEAEARAMLESTADRILRQAAASSDDRIKVAIAPLTAAQREMERRFDRVDAGIGKVGDKLDRLAEHMSDIESASNAARTRKGR